MPKWELPDPRQYPYDMVVYALPTIDGQPLTDSQEVAAVCDDEVRGIGRWVSWGDTRYMVLRIYSYFNAKGPYSEMNPLDPMYPYDMTEARPERFVIRLYDHDTQTLYELPDTIDFDGEAHGSLSALYPLNFKSGD